MKSKDELNLIKEEVETVNKKFNELTEEDLAQVSGGGCFGPGISTKPGYELPNPSRGNYNIVEGQQ